jgi:hypothetical protein
MILSSGNKTTDILSYGFMTACVRSEDLLQLTKRVQMRIEVQEAGGTESRVDHRRAKVDLGDSRVEVSFQAAYVWLDILPLGDVHDRVTNEPACLDAAPTRVLTDGRYRVCGCPEEDFFIPVAAKAVDGVEDWRVVEILIVEGPVPVPEMKIQTIVERNEQMLKRTAELRSSCTR